MLLIKRTAERTGTDAPRFTVLIPGGAGPADVALASGAGLVEAAGVLVARGFSTSEVLAVLGRATEKGEATLGEDELVEVRLPHRDDVQVASKWTAVNRFRSAYMAALTAPAWEREDAEVESQRWETAAVRIAPDAAERVCLSAEVWQLRRARAVERRYENWLG